MSVKNRVCLVVIDGWGEVEKKEGNAIHNATTPVMDGMKNGTHTTLDAHGLSVGLPAGLMGNSEVGHTNIGCGRVVYQDIVAINMACENKSIYERPAVKEACLRAKNGNGRLHLVGLVSDGGVHSHINHLFTLIDAAKHHGVPKCFVQYFADGRDTRPTSGVTYVQQVLDHIKSVNYGSLATIIGRYYAMDRDTRWERIQKAYEGLTQGIGERTKPEELIEFIRNRYEREGPSRQTDEFLTPIIADEDGRLKDSDTVIFIDFRADRMRQIVQTIGIKPPFKTNVIPTDLHIACMTEYKKEFPFPLIFPPEVPKNVLSEVVASQGLRQYHVAETEKYAHVTFFFNGGQEAAFAKEDRKMVPSPKVATYDLLPPMSSSGVAEEVVTAVESELYPFIMLNFAPPDMVGHTGVYDAALKACEATDVAIGRIRDACEKHNYILLVTSDHGNAEQMISEQGGPHTAHTCNRVPFNMTGSLKFRDFTHNAALCDVAPTVLDIMGIDKPAEMTGQSLLAK